MYVIIAQSEGRYSDSLEKCKHTMKKVEDLPEGSLKNKSDVVASLYSSMGNAYLEMNKFSQALKFHTKDLNIARDKLVLFHFHLINLYIFLFFLNGIIMLP